MKQLYLFLFLCLCIVSISGQSKESADFLEIETLSQFAKTPEKIENIYQKYQNTQGWKKSSINFYMAKLMLERGEKEKAIDFFEKAVQYGFDDYFAIFQAKQFKSLYANPKFQEIYKRIRITKADSIEMFWLKSEIQHVSHDTSMMITENLGRKDNDSTVIPQSQVSMRPTKSHTIQKYRALLRHMQKMQIFYVKSSDNSRRSHLISMNIIDNMGSTGKYNYYQSMLKLQARKRSRLQAQMRADNRKRAVQNRRLVIPPGSEDIILPCPVLGDPTTTDLANKYQKKFKKTQLLKAKRKKKTSKETQKKKTSKAPLTSYNIGDFVAYNQVVQIGSQIQKSIITSTIFKKEDNRFYYKQKTEMQGKQPATITGVVELQDTLKKHIYRMLRKAGPVQFLKYSEKAGQYKTAKGMVSVTLAQVSFLWTINNRSIQTIAVFYASSDIPVFGYYGCQISGNNGAIRIIQYVKDFKHTKQEKMVEKNTTQETDNSTASAEAGAEIEAQETTPEDLPSPIAGSKIGNRSVIIQKLRVLGQPETSYNMKFEVTSVTEKHIEVKQLITANGATYQKSERLLLFPTLKEHLVHSLSKEGEVTLTSYNLEKATYTYNGEVKNVVCVKIKWTWLIRGKSTNWEATMYADPLLKGFGYYYFIMRTTNGTVEVEQKLQSYSFGK